MSVYFSTQPNSKVQANCKQENRQKIRTKIHNENVYSLTPKSKLRKFENLKITNTRQNYERKINGCTIQTDNYLLQE